MRTSLFYAVTAFGFLCSVTSVLHPTPLFAKGVTGAVAMHGEAALPPDYACFPKADPKAKSSEALKLAEIGGLDSLNFFITLGTTPYAAREWMYDSLMRRRPDEPFSLYPLIAGVERMTEDRKTVIFKINDRARFKNGKKITADDLIFTFNLLKDKGRFNYRGYYKAVLAVEKLDNLRVKFSLSGENRELSLILALMPVLSAEDTPVEDFDKPSLTPPEGAGAYRVKKLDAGRSIVLERDPNYWAEDLPVNCGRFNFDEVRISMFKNERAAFEAFRAGEIDLFREGDLNRLKSGYDFPGAKAGKVELYKIFSGRPAGMYGFALNTRRSPLNDPALREAMFKAFDYDGVSSRYFYGAYDQLRGYFDYSPLSSFEALRLPPTEEDVDTLYDPEAARSDRREIRRAAFAALKKKGYDFKNGALMTPKGEPIILEVLLTDTKEERTALAFADDMRDLGIKINVRLADGAAYEKRKSEYDYDIVTHRWYNSLSPGTEQINYWGCAGKETPGTRNYPGVCSPEIDKAIEDLLAAREYEALTASARKLDVLLAEGRYVIPLGLSPYSVIAGRDGLTNVTHDTTLLYKSDE